MQIVPAMILNARQHSGSPLWNMLPECRVCCQAVFFLSFALPAKSQCFAEVYRPAPVICQKIQQNGLGRQAAKWSFAKDDLARVRSRAPNISHACFLRKYGALRMNPSKFLPAYGALLFEG